MPGLPFTASWLVPTLVQILNGEKPANTPPIRMDFVPCTRVSYSNGGVTIEKLLMMDVAASHSRTSCARLCSISWA